jgi:hypothetical protein
LNLYNNNYFHNSLIKSKEKKYSKINFFFTVNLAPYNCIAVCCQSSAKTYSKIVDYVHNELRSAFELTHLLENYSLSLLGYFQTKD